MLQKILQNPYLPSRTMRVMKIEDYKVNWNCRFHPTNWWHEIGCPHKDWSKEDLQRALELAKKSHDYLLDVMKQEPIIAGE